MFLGKRPQMVVLGDPREVDPPETFFAESQGDGAPFG